MDNIGFGHAKIIDHLSIMDTTRSNGELDKIDKAYKDMEQLAKQYNVKIIMKVSDWLQNYADEHNCYVTKDSLYSPMYHAFNHPPKKKYDEEDGDWSWHCSCTKRRCPNDCNGRISLDNLIPKTLVDDLASIDKPILYTPKSK